MLGLEHGVLELHTYTGEWTILYQEEESLLLSAIGEYILEFQHIGSTAIPGMLAKPIIDIAAAFEDFEAAKICIQPVTQLGYEYRGEYGIPGRYYYVKGIPRTHHLHIYESTSHEWKDHLYFRDRLIGNPGLAEKYAGLKLELAQKHTNNRLAYQEGKKRFIQDVLRNAR